MGETGTCWSKSLQRAWTLSYERQRSGTVQPKCEMAQVKHQCLQKSEQRWCCKDGDGLFSVAAVKGQWAQIKYRRFQLKIRMHFFFSCEGSQTVEHGAPQRLLIPHLWRCSKPYWTWPRSTCGSQPCSVQGGESI